MGCSCFLAYFVNSLANVSIRVGKISKGWEFLGGLGDFWGGFKKILGGGQQKLSGGSNIF